MKALWLIAATVTVAYFMAVAAAGEQCALATVAYMGAMTSLVVLDIHWRRR